MRSLVALLLLASLALAQGVVLTRLWTSSPRLAVPIGLTVSEEGAVLLTDTPVNGGGSATLFSRNGAVLSNVFYAQGVGSASYSNDTFAFVTLAGNVIFMAPNGTVVKSVRVSPNAALMMSLSPSGKEFVVCHAICEAYRGNKKLWTFSDVKEVTSPPAWVGSTVYVPDGGARKVYALSASSGKVLYSLSYKEPVYAVAACKDVLAVGVGKEVYLYSVAKGFPQLQAKVNAGAPVNDVAFSDDCNVMLIAAGNWLLVVDRNGKVLSNVSMGSAVMLIDWKGNYVAVATVDSAGVERVSLFQANVVQGTPKTRYKLVFKTVNARAVLPLTYPNPQGIVYVLALTDKGYEIWTLINGTVVGRVSVPRNAKFVEDVRTGEVATYNKELLLVMNNTLYEIFGNSMKPLMKLRTNSRFSSFIKIGKKVYAVEVNVTAKNTTNVACGFRALNGQIERRFSFTVPAKRVGVVADAIDAMGCVVTWINGTNLYYYYKGVNGEAKGNVSLLNAVGVGVLFMEVKKNYTNPYVIVNVPAPNGHVIMRFTDVLNKKVLKFRVPAVYTVIGVGDYLGEGYYGDLALLALNRNNGHSELIIVNTKNITRTYDLGSIRRSVAAVSGLALHEGYIKNVFGLGNLNGPTLDVRTNIGTLKFSIEGVTIIPSRMNLLLTITAKQMCYTATINPLTPGGNVYLATGCLPR